MKKFFIAVSIIFCITAFTKNDAQALTVGDEIVTDTVIFFAEGHLLDESSISVGLNARF